MTEYVLQQMHPYLGHSQKINERISIYVLFDPDNSWRFSVQLRDDKNKIYPKRRSFLELDDAVREAVEMCREQQYNKRAHA